VWSAILSADGALDGTADGALQLTMPHLASAGTPIAALRAFDGDGGAAGALAYSLTGPSAALLALSFNLSGVATLGVGSSLVGALGGWINVTVIAADGGLPPLSVTASIRVFVALSYVRPVYPAPTVLRISRPGHDRLEVAEVVALSPPGGAAGGANVAAGAPALSSDTHFGWFGAGEPLGPQPAYLVTNGVYRDYASVWLGAVAPEPAAASHTEA